jgi:hypothetical protein
MAVLLAVLAAAVQAGAADAAHDHGPALQPIAARYQAQVSDGAGRTLGSGDWYIWRDADRIETLRPGAGLAEIWERDQRGQITLTRVFRHDKRLVEYLPRELKALRIEPSWEVLGTVIDRHNLAALKRVRTVRLSHGPATLYRGEVDGQSMRVWWLKEHGLPARIERRTPDGRFVLALKSLHPQPPAGWPRSTEVELNEYLRIDAADFGDMAYDPFVQKIERLDVLSGVLGSAVHAHHAH